MIHQLGSFNSLNKLAPPKPVDLKESIRSLLLPFTFEFDGINTFFDNLSIREEYYDAKTLSLLQKHLIYGIQKLKSNEKKFPCLELKENQNAEFKLDLCAIIEDNISLQKLCKTNNSAFDLIDFDYRNPESWVLDPGTLIFFHIISSEDQMVP